MWRQTCSVSPTPPILQRYSRYFVLSGVCGRQLEVPNTLFQQGKQGPSGRQSEVGALISYAVGICKSRQRESKGSVLGGREWFPAYERALDAVRGYGTEPRPPGTVSPSHPAPRPDGRPRNKRSASQQQRLAASRTPAGSGKWDTNGDGSSTGLASGLREMKRGDAGLKITQGGGFWASGGERAQFKPCEDVSRVLQRVPRKSAGLSFTRHQPDWQPPTQETRKRIIATGTVLPGRSDARPWLRRAARGKVARWRGESGIEGGGRADWTGEAPFPGPQRAWNGQMCCRYSMYRMYHMYLVIWMNMRAPRD